MLTFNSLSTMVYETSYESGRRPFLPDTKRGYWANPNDFIYAGLGLAFRLDVFSMSWLFMMGSSGKYITWHANK